MNKLKYSGCIYAITNRINGKQYVGRTNDFRRRYNEHFGTAKEGCLVLRRAMHKYGKENFTMKSIFEIRTNNLQTLDFLLNSMEQYYIRRYDTFRYGYNATIGGEGTSGMVVTEENRKKRAAALKGKHRTKEQRERMRQIKIGVPMTEEAYKSFMAWFPYRDKKTIYAKVGAALRGRKRDKDVVMRGATKRRKPVLQYSITGEFIKELSGATFFGDNKEANIIACCKRKINSAYGYIWRYKNGENIPMKINKPNITHTANRPLLQYTKDGIFIQEFSCVNDAVHKIGVSRSAVANCLAGLSQSSGGYKWKYKEEGGI